MSREAAAIARRAAEIQQERGICKTGLWDAENRVCLWGALKLAAEKLGGSQFAGAGEFVSTLHEMFPNEVTAFPGSWFNDRDSTDTLDVAKVLLQLADRLELS